MNYEYALFIPYENIDNKCAVLVNENYYYVYDIINGELSQEYDVVLFNNYFKFKGKESYDFLVTDCYSNITNNFYYRNDISNILINVLIISLFGIYLPWRIFTRFIKKVR